MAKIEEEIYQKKFKHEKEKLLINIMFTSSYVSNALQEIMKDKDITLQQYNVLRILRGSFPEPISTKTIRERMIEKMSDTPKIVERMYKKKLLKKRVCKTDKRLVDVVISEEGLEILSYFDTVYDRFRNVLSGLTDEEAAQLNLLLDKARP